MRNPAGEMPFLDHLEELRKRILLSVAGLALGFGAGWWVTNQFDLIHRFEAPIAPYLPGGKLMVMTPISPFMIVLKFSLLIGIILASPWVIYQLWLFLAPALTPREKRAILPALGAGTVLFGAGAATGWFFVLQPTVRWLIHFHSGDFLTQITYDSYLELVVHLLIAMGVSAELPLVMILLASLGIMSYRRYASWRRYAYFLCLIGGAILSPVPEAVSMLLFTLPLIALYEVGVFGSRLVERRGVTRSAAIAGIVLCGMLMSAPRTLHAQQPGLPGAPGPPTSADTTLRNIAGQGVRPIDSSTAKRLGIPSGPTRTFPGPDSIMQSLLNRKDFASTRFMADSASFLVDSQQTLLAGHAATLRDKEQLEADRIIDYDAQCLAEAEGEPRMFQPGHAPVIGLTMRFNTCQQRGIVGSALTSIPMGGANWFVRGNLLPEEGGKLIYLANGAFTSCDLPDPHYHFVAKQVKWESGPNGVIVARPAVLYVRDVPVAWIPFLFQPTKTGRSSGILIPHFGFNDIVRPTNTYNRSITNLGYYWAPNDYIDALAHFDWNANRNVGWVGAFNYHWLNRFVEGGLTLSDIIQTYGDHSDDKSIAWSHNQAFDINTKLVFNLQYQSNSQVSVNNSIDPQVLTRSIESDLQLRKTYAWGEIDIGGHRDQPVGLSPNPTTTLLPQLTITPRTLALGRHFSITPSLNFTNTETDTPGSPFADFTSGGIDTSAFTTRARTTNLALGGTVVIFGFQVSNNIQYQDNHSFGPVTTTQRVPNLASADPNDSATVTTTRTGSYESGLVYTPSVSLPVLFKGSWKVTPTLGIANADPSAPLIVRTAGSGGRWVSQGFKPDISLQSAPSFFGFFDQGFGPYQRFRYTLSPIFKVEYSPAASVSPDFARAMAALSGQLVTLQPAALSASVTLNQVIEGKARQAKGDTNTDPQHLASLRKTRLLSIATSSVSYDFEQAKLAGRSGWLTSGLTNSFQSDLLQGFQLQLTHDLWQGTAGYDTARFSPFLSAVQANFSITGRTFHSIGSLFGLTRHDTVTGPTSAIPGASSPMAAAAPYSMMNATNGIPAALPRAGFSAQISYSLQRYRPLGDSLQPISTAAPTPGQNPGPFDSVSAIHIPAAPATSQLGLTVAFSPTPFWTASWQTQYDFQTHTFQSQSITLQRDLHDWRATFNFTKGPNGNFALQFMIYLMSLPDIKFNYNQSTLQQAPVTP